MGPGGGHAGRFNKAEKLKDPKSTINVYIAYMGHQVGLLVLVFIFCIISTVVSVLATEVLWGCH